MLTYAETVDLLEDTARGEAKDMGGVVLGVHGAPLRADAQGGYLGNGPATVKAKVVWAQAKGALGVVFWELGQDKLGHPASLLSAAAAAMGGMGGLGADAIAPLHSAGESQGGASGGEGESTVGPKRDQREL